MSLDNLGVRLWGWAAVGGAGRRRGAYTQIRRRQARNNPAVYPDYPAECVPKSPSIRVFGQVSAGSAACLQDGCSTR
jgi:hypothetical protein